MAAIIANQLPFVSIVLPARNEENYIRACMQSLLNCDYPHDSMEILVVDGDSDDRTAGIVFEIARFDPRVRLIRNPDRTVPFGMNRGIRASHGDVIVRVDAHAEYPANYVRQSVHSLLATGADNVGGSWRTLPGAKTAMAKAISLCLTHPFGVGNAGYRIGSKEGFVDTVPFGSYRRSVFNSTGLFQECLTRHQDYELNSRIRKAGGRIFLDGSLACSYYARPNLRALLKQKFSDGKWDVYSWLVCPEAFAMRHAIPGIVTAAALLLAAAAIATPIAMSVLVFCAAAYLFASAVATLDLLLSRRSVAALLCPFVFPVLHFGHGLGVMAGVVTARGWAKKAMPYRPAPTMPVADGLLEETAA